METRTEIDWELLKFGEFDLSTLPIWGTGADSVQTLFSILMSHLEKGCCSVRFFANEFNPVSFIGGDITISCPSPNTLHIVGTLRGYPDALLTPPPFRNIQKILSRSPKRASFENTFPFTEGVGYVSRLIYALINLGWNVELIHSQDKGGKF